MKTFPQELVSSINEWEKQFNKAVKKQDGPLMYFYWKKFSKLGQTITEIAEREANLTSISIERRLNKN